ncbi:hypothetical protein J6590_086335 [Homalodisca vitripennis]|nr:hypothetical protein J6590_086335 [Homalodisca vitripennis]
MWMVIDSAIDLACLASRTGPTTLWRRQWGHILECFAISLDVLRTDIDIQTESKVFISYRQTKEKLKIENAQWQDYNRMANGVQHVRQRRRAYMRQDAAIHQASTMLIQGRYNEAQFLNRVSHYTLSLADTMRAERVRLAAFPGNDGRRVAAAEPAMPPPLLQAEQNSRPAPEVGNFLLLQQYGQTASASCSNSRPTASPPAAVVAPPPPPPAAVVTPPPSPPAAVVAPPPPPPEAVVAPPPPPPAAIVAPPPPPPAAIVVPPPPPLRCLLKCKQLALLLRHPLRQHLEGTA